MVVKISLKRGFLVSAKAASEGWTAMRSTRCPCIWKLIGGGGDMIIHGDCLEVLKTLETDSIDSLVSDPPAGISFMGKSWDSDKGGSKEWIAWMREVMKEALRVMKPGAHGLVWAIPRTSHWTATALEEAGFEIRDVITHLFGSGFPKSLDISKALDKSAGVERPSTPQVRCDGRTQYNKEGGGWKNSSDKYLHHPVFEGSTDEAKKWQGWGTALKPASEHWILIRKPISQKTVAANVLKWATGGINIDGCRIEATDSAGFEKNWKREFITNIKGGNYSNGKARGAINNYSAPLGRFPANLVLSHSSHCTDDQCDIGCAVNMLDQQSNILKSGGRKEGVRNGIGYHGGSGDGGPAIKANVGGASRFFYCAKISASERNAGLEDMPDKTFSRSNGGRAEVARGNAIDRSEVGSGYDATYNVKNNHPTVKPQKLMRYLCRLITPPGGLVLDPFAGSGSTGLAAIKEGFRFIGIEKEKEYVEIAEKRIFNAFPEFKKQISETEKEA